MEHPDSLYEEQQQFRQSWLWTLVIVTNAAALIGVVIALESTTWQVSCAEFLPILLMVVIIIAVWLLLWTARLETRVTAEGLRFRFRPFHRREHEIRWGDVEKMSLRTYRPIIEYGGWGIRYGLRGRAYNVSGNIGLQIVLKDGKKVLFGTQESDRLAMVLRSMFPHIFSAE
jgi:hypothetical protein